MEPPPGTTQWAKKILKKVASGNVPMGMLGSWKGNGRRGEKTSVLEACMPMPGGTSADFEQQYVVMDVIAGL